MHDEDLVSSDPAGGSGGGGLVEGNGGVAVRAGSGAVPEDVSPATSVADGAKNTDEPTVYATPVGDAPTVYSAPVGPDSAESGEDPTVYSAPVGSEPAGVADEATVHATPDAAEPTVRAAPVGEEPTVYSAPVGSDAAPQEAETFLTAEAMEFFAVADSAAQPPVAPAAAPGEAPSAKTFGVPEIFRADEPTRFLVAPEPEAGQPADEPAAAEPVVELPKVVRDPDDADTVVFAGVLDLDEPHVVPAEAAKAERSKNNPAALIGVFTMILCSVLGLGLIGRIDNAKPLAGRAVAAPFTVTPPPAGTEPMRPRAVQRLEDHPLLVNPRSLPEVACDLPKFSTGDQQLADYYTAGLKCLDEAWGPVLKEANLPFEPPALDAAPELSNGPCGAAPASEDAVAYYCGRNRMIYMPTGRLRENGGGDRPATHLATLAHEYGHHVQAMTGILRAADMKIVNAGEKTPAGLEMSRRIELQANCFAGMFLGAVAGKGSISAELANRAEEDFQYAMEESPEKNAHGSPTNQGNWALSGFEANTTDACNTYAAPASEVS